MHKVTRLRNGGAQLRLESLRESRKIQNVYLFGDVTCQKVKFVILKVTLLESQQNNFSNWSQVGSHGIEAAWAGGRNGRQVMDRFFPLVPDLLSPRGFFYLVTIKENNPGNTDQFTFPRRTLLESQVHNVKDYNV